MASLANLIAELPQSAQQILSSHATYAEVKDVNFCHFCLDSRKIEQDSAFVLLKSAVNHDDAKSKGYAQTASQTCALVLSEIDLSDADINSPWIFLPKIRQYLGDLQLALLQQLTPTTLANVMAVTGTNGKTSIATLTTQLLAHHHKVALMGTAGNGIYPNLTAASHTTTDVLNLHNNYHDFSAQQADVLCLEASSHGLHQLRLQGLPIQVAIYTNLSRDHLDYHYTMADYAAAKALLFSKAHFPSLEYAIINADDDYAATMIAATKDTDVTLWRYSLTDAHAEFYVSNYQANHAGVTLQLQTPFGELNISSPLLGEFNIANLVASIAAALALAVPFDNIACYVNQLAGARGRMEAYLHNGVNYIVDYAHTPDALVQAIKSLRLHAQADNCQLHAVFGCGGDRDRGKRPLMMNAALEADNIIVTADNPRSEDPNDIITDMVAELTEAQKNSITIEPDRKLAIQQAIAQAKTGDMVLIAGKGHETYQEIKGVRHDFDDMAVLQALLA